MVINKNKFRGGVMHHGKFDQGINVYGGRIGISPISYWWGQFDHSIFCKSIKAGKMGSKKLAILNLLDSLDLGKIFHAVYFDNVTNKLYILISSGMQAELNGVGMSILSLNEDELFLADRPILCSDMRYLYHLLKGGEIITFN